MNRQSMSCSLIFVSALLTAGMSPSVMSAVHTPEMIWSSERTHEPDTYIAFRGRIEITVSGEVELRTLGSGWYAIWLDGKYLLEGPDRFDIPHPQYQLTKLQLTAGSHILAVQAHHLGVTTRMLVDMPPFLYCDMLSGDTRIPIEWKCLKLDGYRQRTRRINPQLGWIEWCDTRMNPTDWQVPTFDDNKWTRPQKMQPKLGSLAPTTIGPVRYFTHSLRPIAEGPLAENYGYERDDVSARFFLRDLECKDLPAQGVWRRYDLGRVRLGRPRFVMDLPAGTVVEFAYSESLQHGRVSPWITLSDGTSCNLDHYVARGGLQEFFPLTPKGGRYVEVHILLAPEHWRTSRQWHQNSTTFVKEEYIERCYHGPAVGSFSCGDPLLDSIWHIGVETLRACSEDALIDNPTRERGQWTGDVVTVGMDINAAAYNDLRLCRRGLTQSAWCANNDGQIAGLCPGGPAYLATYAVQWVDACLHYYQLTGDMHLLEELYPHAVRNIGAFEKFITKDGLIDGMGWVFMDWGYVRNEGPADIGLNLHMLSSLRAMTQWCRIIGKTQDASKYERLSGHIESILQQWLSRQLSKTTVTTAWESVGYHNAVLAMRLGLTDKTSRADCIAYIKRHILNCFPNNQDAPRLSDPHAANRQLITPYFAHYAFPLLIEHGEMDFVLDQYRKCWGWALGDGRTTWVEVFDTRWTHCHQWAGCPTWQLSRYVLGLHSRLDLGADHYVLNVRAGSLPSAKGTLPIPNDDGLIRIEWKRQADGIRYSLDTDKPIWLHLGSVEAAPLRVERDYKAVLP